MKRLISIIILILLVKFSFSQIGDTQTIKVQKKKATTDLTININSANFLYLGIENHISINSCSGNSSQYIKVSNGTIKGENGQYIIVPVADPIIVSVYVKNAKGKESLIEEYTYNVKQIPRAFAKFGNAKITERMSKQEVMSTPGITAELENFDMDCKIEILYFEVFTIINQTHISMASNDNRLHKSQIELLSKVRPSGVFWIENIKAKYPDGSIVELVPIRITVI